MHATGMHGQTAYSVYMLRGAYIESDIFKRPYMPAAARQPHALARDRRLVT